MEAVKETAAESSSGFSKLTSIQKLAALLLILDAGNAAAIMRDLEEQELEAVCAEMAKFTAISQEMQDRFWRSSPPWQLRRRQPSRRGLGVPKTCWKNRWGPFARRTSSAGFRRNAPRLAPCNKSWRWTPVRFTMCSDTSNSRPSPWWSVICLRRRLRNCFPSSGRSCASRWLSVWQPWRPRRLKWWRVWRRNCTLSFPPKAPVR